MATGFGKVLDLPEVTLLASEHEFDVLWCYPAYTR